MHISNPVQQQITIIAAINKYQMEPIKVHSAHKTRSNFASVALPPHNSYNKPLYITFRS